MNDTATIYTPHVPSGELMVVQHFGMVREGKKPNGEDTSRVTDEQVADLTERLKRVEARYSWPQPLDLEALAEREPQPPKFIIEDWLPCGYATLLAGHGGVGKSMIALYLGVCIAAGVPFFGLEVERRRVLYLSCEDREAVLHWRLWRICKHLSIDLAGLRGWLEVLDLVGHPNVLWEKDPRTGATLTAVYAYLDERVAAQRAQVLIGDGISDLFGGNENARGEVKQFVNALLAHIPLDGAVLLLGHIPKPAVAGIGEGYSGSTQWHNAARGRWYLYPETSQNEDGGRPERTGELILELQKSNLGQDNQSMRFSWDEQAHLFLGGGVEGATAFDRKHRDRTEQDAILAALRGCASGTIVVPAAMTGPRTAYHVLKERPEFPNSLRSGRPSVRRFWRQIEALRQMHMLEESSYRRTNRHVTAQIALTAEGMRRCAA